MLIKSYSVTIPLGVTTPLTRRSCSSLGSAVDELAVEDDRVHRWALLHGPERAVEIAAAPAQAHPGAVDGCRRHDDEVDVVDRDRPEQFADRLRHPVAPLGFGLTEHRPIEQTVVPGDRQQQPDLLLLRPVEERADVRLVARGQVGGQRPGAGTLRQFDEILRQALRSPTSRSEEVKLRLRPRSSARSARFWWPTSPVISSSLGGMCR